MDRLRRDTLLGLVFFGSLAFLLWATVNLTDLSVDNVRRRVLFAQAGSAEVGTNVMVLGKKMGKVGDIRLDYRAAKPIEMLLLLREEVPFKSDYSITVRDAGVLGGKQIYIDPGRSGTPVGDDEVLNGTVEPGAFEQIGSITKGEGALGEKLIAAIEQIRLFFANMNDPDTSIGRLTTSREFHDSLLGVTDRFGTILQAVLDQKGTIGDLFMNEETKENVHGFLADLRRVGTQLTTLESPIGVLLNDKDAAADLQTILANINKIVGDVREGRGIVGRLLRDDPLADQFASAVANLDRLLANLTDPKAGAFGALASDPDTAADIKATLANLRHVSDKIASRSGLLGMLINDEDLGIRFRRILTQVSRALEDAREAAPIGNFIQVLLGGF
jgi:ABC-type transporter Mla subunit MlaD